LFNPLEGKYLQILDVNGNVVNSSLDPKLPSTTLKKMYEVMMLTKLADEKALALQRSGRMGTFAQSRGQEAQVGAGFAMEKKDWLIPSFRETGVQLVREWPLENFYLVFMGCEEGSKAPKGVNNFPVAVPVGSQMLHAVGLAWASKLKKEKVCAVTFFGDGGSSEGDFHEAMNFAGVFATPTVFICQNNQYAISLPRAQQTAAKTIAQKAVAYGFPGMQVDGNDPLATYVATKDALNHARSGNGPTLLEFLTYRLGPHTSSDDPTIYRLDKEVKEWEKKCPIVRFRKYLTKKNLWNKKYEAHLINKCKKQIEVAVKIAEKKIKEIKVEDMFNYTYASLTPELQEQLEYAKKAEGSS
tara:strand:+ start:1328 stop:2395 length:1068 start_codon:yes stop_codon:yes gene_type:complete